MPLKKGVLDKDLYASLGVTPVATRDELRDMYKKLAMKWHPDKAGDTERNKDEFRSIQEAWEVLGDAASRKEYDEYHAKQKQTKAASDGFVRATQPEDPFQGGPSSRQQQQQKQDGAAGATFLSGGYIHAAVSHMRRRVLELDRDLKETHGRLGALARQLTAVYEHKTPVPEHAAWKQLVDQARWAFGNFHRRLDSLKRMIPRAAATHENVAYAVTQAPLKGIARFSGEIFQVIIAVLVLAQLVADFERGRDVQVEIKEQLKIIALPSQH
ncbi:hypothetical protein F4781DRAFT_443162 [Annulohypoxylon bovei var. microspora]|nr:hypothetical protein F4781DRAFT_443162 [Annulohypoxylon bovei var. microspora]